MQQLSRQLSFTLLMLSLASIFQAVLACCRVQFKLWYKRRQLAKTQGNEELQRTYLEEQSDFLPSDMNDEINSTVQLMLSLGYVLLFGAIAPVVVLFCLLVFVVQVRVSAFLLTSSTKRQTQREGRHENAWDVILGRMTSMGMVSTGFLLVSYGDSFQAASTLTRIAALGLWCVLGTVIGGLVDVVVLPHGVGAGLLRRRRRHVVKAVMSVGEERYANAKPTGSSAAASGSSAELAFLAAEDLARLFEEGSSASAVELGHWDRIPKF